VVLMAHNKQLTTGYTGDTHPRNLYAPLTAWSIHVDPWRSMTDDSVYQVIHYGNTRQPQNQR